MKPTDIRIDDVRHHFEDYRYRTPIKFGGTVLDRVTLLNVTCRVSTQSGKSAEGFGSMPLGNVWSFPSRVLKYEETLGAMKTLADRIARLTKSCTEVGHPIDLNHALEPDYIKAAAEVSRQLNLAEPIPMLSTLVTASPFDAALHDGFGKVHGLNPLLTTPTDRIFAGARSRPLPRSRRLSRSQARTIPPARAPAQHAALPSRRCP